MLLDGRWTGPILDQHMHLDRSNRFLDAVSEFTLAGGTGIMLVHKPNFSSDLPTDLDGYRAAYSDTLSMAEEVRAAYGIEVGVVLGPHPVVWEHQIVPLGLKRATELHLEAVSLALDHIEAGDAVCLGEVGRPHYQVSDEIWSSANEMLREVMAMAAGVGTSIQLHVEDNGETTCRELATLCDKAGLARNRAIRHYAPANVGANFTHGLAATVSVGKGSVEAITATAASANAPWGMETDFLDDPRRPGAVLGPKTVPKRTQQLCTALQAADWDDDKVSELLNSIHNDWPSQLYSVGN
ncbi:MAG: TatD family hydrolase [Candidatus Thalassarchaeum sp.]|nr:TatD family hydrolase [Candidatus Thalassarchaeum sp.]